MTEKGCVILAAGRNTRLDTGKPKTLLKLNNLTLLERHVKLFSNSGVKKFCVITGHQSKAIEEEIESIKKKYTCDITPTYNERFDLENGLSVWMAKEWVKKNHFGSFYLTMADHVFEIDFVSKFLSANRSFKDKKLYLAVDRPGPQNAHIDLEDVTKVSTEGLSIKEIGKHLKEYHYFDTGLFEISQDIFKVFEDSFDDEKYSISNTVQRLAKSKLAEVVEISGHLWNDVDSPDDYQSTLRIRLD